jgi:signal transduction histidine kinase
MFLKTRLKLTAWYLLIIMAISISFSAFIYFGATQEFDRIIRMQEYRTQHPEVHVNITQGNSFVVEQFPNVPAPDIDVIQEARLRVLGGLVEVNLIILMLSSLAGYFLAGRTLRPIKQMVDEQNRFITDASHELNTPLTSLKTSIEVNLRDKTLNLEKAKKVLSGNLDDIDSMQSLSDELIGLTQYQKPNGNFKFDKVDISSTINSAFGKVKSVARKKQITFSINSTKLFINGDEKSLTELFVILFDNAIKYSKDKKSVKVKAQKTDSKVEIVVEDEGIGIGKEDLPYIFDRFYRADKSRTKQQFAGYGLGLSIAKRIVSLHNGTIVVESELGKKTVFKITFPAT